MRIHTDRLTLADIHNAAADLPGVYITATEHGSRSHARAFEVRMEGNGYRRNSGQYGADDEFGATWDEWGVIIGRLYLIDPEALWGTPKYPTYRNADDFNQQTAWRFAEGQMPDDTHKRHTWTYDKAGAQCKKCSAQMNRRIAA